MVANRRVIALIVALGVAVAVFVFRGDSVVVETAEVRRGPLAVTVDEEGRTRVRERYTIAAPVNGRLERIEVDEGDRVEPGAVLARMHPQPLDRRLVAEAEARLAGAQAARDEARARLEQSRAALDQARRNVERARRLAAAGNISREGLELAELEEISRRKEVAAAEHAADRAEFDVKAADAALMASGGARTEDGEIRLTAPVAGSVLRVYEESERVVGVGTPVVELGEPSQIEVVVDVLSKDAVAVRPGARVVLEEWGGDKPIAGRVRRVEPSGFKKVSALGVEEQRVNVIIDFDTIPENVGDNFRVEAKITVWESADVLQIPASALFRSGNGWAVYVDDAGTARAKSVEVGHLGNGRAEVAGGLAEGQFVVVHPSDQLREGVALSARTSPRE